MARPVEHGSPDSLTSATIRISLEQKRFQVRLQELHDENLLRCRRHIRAGVLGRARFAQIKLVDWASGLSFVWPSRARWRSSPRLVVPEAERGRGAIAEPTARPLYELRRFASRAAVHLTIVNYIRS